MRLSILYASGCDLGTEYKSKSSSHERAKGHGWLNYIAASFQLSMSCGSLQQSTCTVGSKGAYV